MSPDQTEQHCAGLVRERNRPRFVASLFAPQLVRRSLLALYAFDSELSRLPSVAPEPMIAAIRFQWWRDAIDPAIQGDRGHPILFELALAAAQASLGTAELMALIDAREDAGGDSAKAETIAISAAARLCGAAAGPNDMAELAAIAISSANLEDIQSARNRWRSQRRLRRAELPAYLPVAFADLKHPVSDLALYSRALVRALRNRI